MDKEPTGQQEAPNAQDQMLKGSAWMTAGSIFSRILGAIYIVPWRIWLGAAFLTANALFTKGYQIYSIFLLISTAGVPGAISKQVSHYNAMGEYRTGLRIFGHGAIALSLLGVASCVLLWLLAPILAVHDAALTAVFRSLSWPLLLIPILSIMRGFFQGYNDMAPSAISQFVEQLARIIYMLVMTYVIMKLGSGNYVSAVTQSTFAAFIGAIFGLAILVWYFAKQRPRLMKLAANGKDDLNISVRQILIDIFRQAIPFVVMDSAINIYYIVDQYTFTPMMQAHYIVSKVRLDQIYALFAGNANKLIMIIVSLAVAMAVTALPLISAAKTRGNFKALSDQITNTLQLFFFVMIPAAVGMMAIAQPIYVLFYGYDKLGISLLEQSCFLAVMLGLFSVLASLLQGMFHNKLAIVQMLVGLALKFILQWPLIVFFNVYGPTLASIIGMLVSCGLMLHSLQIRYHYKFRQTLRRLLGILLFSALMFVAVRLVIWLLSFLVSPERAVGCIILVVVALPVGVLVYGYAVLKTRLADLIMGERVQRLREVLHIG